MRRTHAFWTSSLAVAAVFCFGLGGTVPGCGSPVSYCNDRISDHKDHNGNPDPCCVVDPCDDGDGGVDAGGPESGGPTCSCVAGAPPDWDGPAPVWIGPPSEKPVCPLGSTFPSDYVEEVDSEPAKCGCSCKTPVGTCGPTTVFTVSSADCLGTGGALTPFAPPSVDWDGSCTSFGAIPAGALCNGVPCVRSLTAAPLSVLSESCTPVTPAPVVPAWEVKTAVRVCGGTPPESCDDPSETCVPSAPHFKACISHDDDVACPAPYSDKHVILTDIEDHRGCKPCKCAPPSGGLCTGTLNVFTDGTCGASLFSDQLTSTASACINIAPAGAALSSKSITDLQYLPGACGALGGNPTGDVAHTVAATFCCLP